MEHRPVVGVIGGSGLYRMPDLMNVEPVEVTTPFGAPSDRILVGSIDGIDVAFLPRHGHLHQFSPTNVPARANIWALKAIGIRRLISLSAVGSLRENLHPLDFVVPDQIFDRTMSRPRTFFDDIVIHVSLADPFCEQARRRLVTAAGQRGIAAHDGGTYICIEGPQFSTKAESRVYRSWGADVIGMTAMPEARLAREAGLCYATLAMVTDYDVWHETEESVTVQAVVENLQRNVVHAQDVLRAVLPLLQDDWECPCAGALHGAIATAAEGISAEIRERLALLLQDESE